MRRMMMGNSQSREILAVAAGAIVVAISISSMGLRLGPISIAEGSAIAGGYFVIVLGSILLLGVRGLLGLWSASLLLWALLLLQMFRQSNWALAEAAQHIPEPFLVWSFLAFPLWVTTALLGRGLHANRSTVVVERAGMAIWLALLLANWYLAGFAIDVGPTPRQSSGWISLMVTLAAPFPFAASGMMISRAHRCI